MLPEADRIAHYDVAYYTQRNCVEVNAHNAGLLRADQWAALCYAHGYTSYEDVCGMLDQPTIGYWSVSYRDFVRFRIPRLVLDVGCGAGDLTRAFVSSGTICVGIDPSPGALQLCADLDGFVNIDFLAYMREPHRHLDTIVLCETVEHIRPSDLSTAWSIIATSFSGLVVITNWIDKHPIRPDRTGYDHIRHVDDDLYDELASTATQVVLRDRSHLVLRF